MNTNCYQGKSSLNGETEDERVLCRDGNQICYQRLRQRGWLRGGNIDIDQRHCKDDVGRTDLLRWHWPWDESEYTSSGSRSSGEPQQHWQQLNAAMK